MNNIYITGLNLISNLGVDINEIWNKLNLENDVETLSMPIKIPMIINKSEIRRMSRYAYMAVYTTKKVLDKREDNKALINKERIGTIFNTGYGPLTTNIKFGETVNKDNPDFASPTVFSSTVSNACVGNVCMTTGLKGASTILMGSNNVGYSYELLNNGSADGIVTGGIEEYCEPLFNAFAENKNEKTKLSECCATIFMEKFNENKLIESLEDEIYCEVVGYNDINLCGHPLIVEDFKVDSSDLETNMRKVLTANNIEEKDIDLVVTAANGVESFDNNELEAIRNIFGRDVLTISPKLILGETLGASITLNTIIGAMVLKNQEIPKLLKSEVVDKKINYVLVNGIDVSGNTTSILLKAYK